jgi:hypothetical protein
MLTITDLSYPWKAYQGSIESLGDKNSEVEWVRGKAFIIVPPSPTDLNFVNDSKFGVVHK